MGVVVVIGILAFAGWSWLSQDKQQAFDREKILAASNAAAVVQLPEDYDTEDVQVRHLSWGKLNYYPEMITVKAGKKVQLVGDLERLQGCFRSLTIPDLKVNGQFAEGKETVEFTPTQKGTFGFGCSMGMGNGRLVVG